MNKVRIHVVSAILAPIMIITIFYFMSWMALGIGSIAPYVFFADWEGIGFWRIMIYGSLVHLVFIGPFLIMTYDHKLFIWIRSPKIFNSAMCFLFDGVDLDTIWVWVAIEMAAIMFLIFGALSGFSW